MGTAPAAWIFLLFFLLSTDPGECKVYYDCGAVLNPTGKDLILSPGFPNNYLPGSHCLWQIFVPAGSSIVLETLYFDVFESSGNTEPAVSSSSSERSHSANKRAKQDGYMEASLPNDLEMVPTAELEGHANEANSQVFTPDTWDKSEKVMKRLLELQDLTEQNLLSQGPDASQKERFSTVTKNFDDLTEDVNRPMKLLAPVTSRLTTVFFQQVSEGVTSSSIGIDTDPFTTTSPVLEVCPLDVLYITDLVTYSSRFCGLNSPLNKSLTFGSPVEMIEVVLELITTTNHGRGFAILFSYHNQSLVTTMGVRERRGRDGVVLLAVIAATISFALVLLLVLCLSNRQRICPKRELNDSQMTAQSGIQNTALEVNELQLVVEDLQNRELESASQVEEVAAAVSQQTHREDPSSSTITVTDSNSDEVFVISSGNNTDRRTFHTYPLQEGNLKRSKTSPASVSDWLTSDCSSVGLSIEDKANEGEDVDPCRQRTWSVRTFNSLLPQLQMKWLRRTSSGSFTKLVDSGCNAPAESLSSKKPRRAGSAIQIGDNSTRLYSESSDSNASYPLTQSSQLQRTLPPCNLKRTRPYFGLLNDSNCDGSEQKSVCAKENYNLYQKSAIEFTSLSKTITGNGLRSKEVSMDFEKPNTVFVICEEADDQQPLVFDDQLNLSTECLPVNHDISCKADDCSIAFTEACSHLSPCMESSGASTFQSVKTNVCLGSAGNLTNHYTTAVGKLDSAVCAQFTSPPIGLVTE
ncbi:uncharacterized protein LOC142161387 isoform X2 [Mixophyes fleayi]|uniref:uncharacterized protein LOC142161387 isoform X2 n=1 Tax=Mixophyes fleayi TaxID=3061075 RepID=UPI003F4DB7B9